MAQRNTPSRSGKPGAPKPSTSKPGSRPGARTSTAAGARSSAGGGRSSGGGARPPARRPNRSIVNQRQTPWGLIITTVVIVAFAAAVIGVVIATHKSPSSSSSSDANCSKMIGSNAVSYLNKNACAVAIKGVTFHAETNRNHVDGHITYNTTPPVGGNHSQYWADCTGTVYPQAIANENAVHMLEHGAIWITYNAKTLPSSQLATLKSYVQGVNRTALSPYPNLKTPVSLQAWGYQLFLHNANDPRIARFIAALKYNPATTPEYGATCSDPSFIQHPSTFGNPLWLPVTGSGGTMAPSAQ